MTIRVFGHKAPDTDSTGSPIIWAWYLNEVRGEAAEAVLLGEPNTEAAFVLDRWNLPRPAIVDDIAPGEAKRSSSSTPTTRPNCPPTSTRPTSAR
jgi:manganese-dependent inorganic pyrophosphatase